MKKTLLNIGLSAVAAATFINAANEGAFPSDWNSFQKIGTTLTKVGGSLPGCDADVSGLPPIYQETISTYCAIKDGGPGKVSTLSKLPRNFEKGIHTAEDVNILHLEDLKVLFVTTYVNGDPEYSTWGEDGTDMSELGAPGLAPNDCRMCHTGYEAYSNHGQVGAWYADIK
jgi:hypothetical protein